jgi:hypothetical protein
MLPTLRGWEAHRLARALEPIDRHHGSLPRPDSPAGFLESLRGHLAAFGFGLLRLGCRDGLGESLEGHAGDT